MPPSTFINLIHYPNHPNHVVTHFRFQHLLSVISPLFFTSSLNVAINFLSQLKTGLSPSKTTSFAIFQVQEIIFPFINLLLMFPTNHFSSFKNPNFLKLMTAATTPRSCHLLIPSNSPFICSWLIVFISSSFVIFQPLYFLKYYPHFPTNTLASQFVIILFMVQWPCYS